MVIGRGTFYSYVRAAKQVLADNWAGHFTKPSSSLYPHQWNWDSGFIAIGYAHYNAQRAKTEIRSLFQGQWENGMLPHIVFDTQSLGHYFPEPDFWQTPDGRPTSGITMPPLHATACLHIYDASRNKNDAMDFLEEMFPRLLASHRYFYSCRDPNHEGLAYIRHPWESGMDNSPAWDEPLQIIAVDKNQLPAYQRKDLEHGVSREQRPTDEDYDRFVYLIDLFRKLKYEEKKIYRECPFLVQDILLNSILCKANLDLLQIASLLGKDTIQIEQWHAATSASIRDKLWCPRCQKFESFDLIANSHIHTATASSFMPLYAKAATKDQAALIYRKINSVSFCALRQGNCFTVPNYDMTRKDYSASNYWRGPVWININWMISQGLRSYGYKEKADSMNSDMIQLPVRFGFHEYFDSRTGRGYGSDNFSWTAALFLDLVYDFYERQGTGRIGRGQQRKLNQTHILNKGQPSGQIEQGELGQLVLSSIKELQSQFYNPIRGVVDYGNLRDSSQYRRYRDLVKELITFDLTALREEARKKAFWINIYNAIIIQGIIELNIRRSVREIKDFFGTVAYLIGGLVFTPEQMEHGILRANRRPPYKLLPLFVIRDARRRYSLADVDPRIHFALVCGSRSCAPIRFYEPGQIDQQLDIAADNFINSSEVIILPEKNKILLSEIFKWYQRDFGGKRNTLNFILKYRVKDDAWYYLKKNIDRIKVEYLYYDWNLNR